MNYYISNGTFYAVPTKSDELMHYGVPGMKWGVRKPRETVSVGGASRRSFGGAPNSTGGRAARQSTKQASGQSGKTNRNSPEAKAARAARAAKAKKAAKIGAAVVGTALAAYGTYKLAQYMQGKRSQSAMKKAQSFIDDNVYKKAGETVFTDGTRSLDFVSRNHGSITTQGTRRDVGKLVGKHNAEVVAKGRQMYRDATNTKFDRGLAKVVNTGDKVKSTAKSTATKVKNKVLDAVNPIYEYTPSTSTKTYRDSAGMNWTEEVTNYVRTKKKRG